ncbi:hypothetical protein [Hoeflea prorocentri]|uniref:Uncharacterized protein n=1 Tax=Hoeflea prorocentri TaxID=1922333 RepID=A0A9X3ZHR6_9HYPH|nr:hypothetical protein [Hoeflea prorocentri]MCY6381015.1 hypothetical protein [Hoeflea prorocentri]MDA5398815.1 hypothetical protein [Hoeflea prorocentri]
MSKHEGKTDIQARPWEIEPPEREAFYWEIEAAALEEARRRELIKRNGSPLDLGPDPTSPDAWVSLDEVYKYIRTCQKHPEIWDHMMPLDLDEDAERVSDEEFWRRSWIHDFQRWYRLKYHPEAHTLFFDQAEYVMEGYLIGEFDDLFGEAAKSKLLDISIIREKRS